jgi:hypothetical protein
LELSTYLEWWGKAEVPWTIRVKTGRRMDWRAGNAMGCP